MSVANFSIGQIVQHKEGIKLDYVRCKKVK
jgi:hypothetical protein